MHSSLFRHRLIGFALFFTTFATVGVAQAQEMLPSLQEAKKYYAVVTDLFNGSFAVDGAIHATAVLGAIVLTAVVSARAR